MLGSANCHFTEMAQIQPAIMPVDLNDAATNGDWVSLKNFHRATVVILASAATGSPTGDLTVTLEQATDVAGTGAKALNMTRYDSKTGAALTAVGQFTVNTQSAANTFSGNGDLEQLYAIDVQPEDLDKDNNFDCIRVSLNQMASEKIGCAFYLLWPARYGASPDLVPSAIIN